MDSLIKNYIDDFASIIDDIKDKCKLNHAECITMKVVRDFGYKRKDALIPNLSTEYRLTKDLYKDLYDLCQCEDCKNGCQLMQEPDGTYYFQIIGQCFSDTRTDSIVGCDTVKVYFKKFVW